MILKQNFLDFNSEKPKICVHEQIFWKCKKKTSFVLILWLKNGGWSYTRRGLIRGILRYIFSRQYAQNLWPLPFARRLPEKCKFSSVRGTNFWNGEMQFFIRKNNFPQWGSKETHLVVRAPRSQNIPGPLSCMGSSWNRSERNHGTEINNCKCHPLGQFFWSQKGVWHGGYVAPCESGSLWHR